MKKKSKGFDEEAIANIEALGEVLYKIHRRLISEGYIITKDEIIDPEGKVVFEK